MHTDSSIAISIKDLSKSYKLYKSPAHRVKETFHPLRKKYNTTFHALKSLSVEIAKGETVGIVGRNGCGKSTLLQIVCGVLSPSVGQVQVNGRISAILELGAGFNPEFSGRDNIYLNCSILGMDRSDIDSRIDEILAFADIGDFIDQPVKTYSSGMAMRLGFAIAINVDPTILVIDEALAVGDSAFQRKCFSRLKSIQEQGATILFVSHIAGAVVELCNRAILLDQGELLYSGSPKRVMALYHKLLFAPEEKIENIRAEIRELAARGFIVEKDSENVEIESGASNEPDEPKVQATFNPHLIPKSTSWYEPDGAFIQEPCILSLENERVNKLCRNEEYIFSYKVKFTRPAFDVRFGMLIKTVRGVELGGYGRRDTTGVFEYIEEGAIAHVKLKFNCSLLPGTYFLNAGVVAVVNQEDRYLHRGIDVAMFEVMEEDNLGATEIVDFGVTPLITIEKPQV